MFDHSSEKSVGIIKEELEKLRNDGLLSPDQYFSIERQLPYNNQPSQYVDQGIGGAHNAPHAQQQHAHQQNVQAVAQAAQDPNHPAHPQHPKHAEWAKHAGERFASAALFGAGASVGSDLIHKIGL